MNARPAMTSRERVLAAGKGLPVDRVPLFYWLNPHGCCKLIATYRPYDGWFGNTAGRLFWNRFHHGGGLGAPYLWRLAPLAMDFYTCNTAAEYAFQLGSDFGVFHHSAPYRFGRLGWHERRPVFKDMYGTVRALGSGIYLDMHVPPIKTAQDLRAFRFPNAKDDTRYDIFRAMRRKYPDKCLAAAVWGAFDFPQTSLLGSERYLTMLVDYPDEMQAFLARWTDEAFEIVRRSVRAGADVVFIMDDYGYNNRTFLSPRMWKRFIYPHLKRLIDEAHAAGALAALHSCGYQMSLLDAYVEAGLDMLQAFQPMAGNDLEQAYAQYGDRLTFITGIDTQQGEIMNPSALQDDIIKNYRIGRSKARFVLGTTHEVQYTMPDANVRTIFETVASLIDGRYDH